MFAPTIPVRRPFHLPFGEKVDFSFVLKDIVMHKKFGVNVKLFAGTLFVISLMGWQSVSAATITYRSFNYSGSTTRYSTLADAQAQTNSNGTFEIGTATNTTAPTSGPVSTNTTLPSRRDAYVIADTSTNKLIFGTSWYFTPPEFLDKVAGFGNPNNTNNGFVQLFDVDGSSVDSMSMGWNQTLDEFSISASGSDASFAEDAARFWPAPDSAGAAEVSFGTYIDYDLQMTAFFNTPTTNGKKLGQLPDGLTGTFTAIFQNTSTDLDSIGFYLVELALQAGSSAEDGNYGSPAHGFFDGFDQTIAGTTFVAPVPIPTALPLFGTGLALMGFIGWRRKRKIAV